jgi:hypothetical protein
MDKKERDVELLKESAEHWRHVATGLDYAGAEMCPLCGVYNKDPEEDQCHDCPIRNKTKLLSCQGSPWEKWVKHMTYGHKDVKVHNKAVPGCEDCRSIALEFAAWLDQLAEETKGDPPVKATLTYDLTDPDAARDHEIAVVSSRLLSALWDFQHEQTAAFPHTFRRAYNKGEYDYKTADEVIEAVNQHYWEIMENNGLDPERLLI